MIVKVKSYNFNCYSWNLNLFTGPKGVIRCGYCGIDSEHRLPLINNPVLKCPHCNTGNKIPVQYGLF